MKRLALTVLVLTATILTPTAAAAGKPVKPPHPPVEWLRTLKLDTAGVDVGVAQRALVQSGDRSAKSKATGYFGAGTQANVKKFQSEHKIAQTGTLGPATQAKLSPYVSTVDYQRMHARWVAAKHDKLLQARYVAIVAHAKYTIAHNAQIHYTQGLARSQIPVWPSIPYNTDCSGYATWSLRSVGVNPGGHQYVGWTGTLGKEGTEVSSHVPSEPGDLVFYENRYPWTHVTVYIGLGFVASHGQEAGPLLERYNYRPVGDVRRYFK